MFSLGYVLSSVPPSCVTSTPRHYKTVTLVIRSRGKCLWSYSLLKTENIQPVGPHQDHPQQLLTSVLTSQIQQLHVTSMVALARLQTWFQEKRAHYSAFSITSVTSCLPSTWFKKKILCLLGLAPFQALRLATPSLLVLPESFRRRKPSWGGTFLASDPPARQANWLTHCSQKPPQNSPLAFGFLPCITPHKIQK